MGFDDQALTEEVLRRFEAAPDPRTKAIAQSLTRHLHAFLREVEPSFEEWAAAIAFLTRVGHTCDERRQEFILLSDVLGASMLVDALNHRQPDGATETTVLGPFFVERAPDFSDGDDISGGAAGEPLFCEVRVLDRAGAPVAGALVDVWQSDDDGFYDVQRPDLYETAALRGRARTGPDGRLRFWSILPTPYPIPDDGPVGDLLAATGRHPWRPAHLHFMIAAPGCETLVTHLFVEGSDYLDSDAVFGVKPSLIRPFPAHAPGEAPDGRRMDRPWRSLTHDFVLKGA